MTTDTKESDSDKKDSVMYPLIYPEDSDDEESLRNLPCADPTLEPGPPRKNIPKN